MEASVHHTGLTTAEAAARQEARRDNQAQQQQQEAEQRAKAAAEAKNLANFEQTGEWGKTAGALFMFFRPAATGAMRAIQAIAPAFMDVRQAKYRLPEHAEAVNLRAELKENKYEEKLWKRHRIYRIRFSI